MFSIRLWTLDFGLWTGPHSALCIFLILPVLDRARFAEFVECAGADESFHFLVERMNAEEKVMERRKGSAGAFVEDAFFGAQGEALEVEEGNTDGIFDF